MSAVLGRCQDGHHYVTLPVSGRRVCLWCEQPAPAQEQRR